jgi:hypothetical protein
MASLGSEIRFDDPDFFKRFYALDDLSCEKKLFSERNNLLAECWTDRLREWEGHLQEYAKLKADGRSSTPAGVALVPKPESTRSSPPETDGSKIIPGGPPAAGTSATDIRPAKAILNTDRIDKLDSMLTVLDSKIGMLLAANSFVLSATGILLSGTPKLTEWIPGVSMIRYGFGFLFNALLFGIVGVCLLNLWFLLRAFRRVVWGNLGKGGADSASREREYVGFLIVSLARRTNMFRIVTHRTKYAVGGFALFALCAAAALTARGVHDVFQEMKSNSPHQSNPGASANLPSGRNVSAPESHTSPVVLTPQKHCREIDIDRSSGSCTVPDASLTPGEMNATLVCISNQDRPRRVSTSEKESILKSYGYRSGTDKSTGEFDHWIPHWMGGSDGPKNIWFEPHAGKFGSLAKDKVELFLWRAVCVKKTMTLAQAKARYLEGWTKLAPQH